MKRQNLIRFFLLSEILAFMLVPCISVSADQEPVNIWTQANIMEENLKISYSDVSPLRIEQGGTRFLGLTPLPTQPIDENFSLFSAIVKFETSIVMWTEVEADEAFTSVSEGFGEYKWLDLGLSVNPDVLEWTTEVYRARFNKIRLGDLTTEARGFNGRLFIESATIEDLTPPQLDFGDLVIVTATTMIGQVDSIKVTDAFFDTIFPVQAVIQEPIQSEGVTVTVTGGPQLFSRPDNQIANEEVFENNLGLFFENRFTPTIQGGTNIVVPVGTENILENGIGFNMKADIKSVTEEVRRRYQYMVVDTETGPLGLDPAGIHPFTRSVDDSIVETRTIAYQIENKIQKVTFEVQGTLFSRVSIVSTEDEEPTDLDLPKGQIDSIFWSNVLQGNIGVALEVEGITPIQEAIGNVLLFLSENLGLVIILAVIALVVVFFVSEGFRLRVFEVFRDVRRELGEASQAREEREGRTTREERERRRR